MDEVSGWHESVQHACLIFDYLTIHAMGTLEVGRERVDMLALRFDRNGAL